MGKIFEALTKAEASAGKKDGAKAEERQPEPDGFSRPPGPTGDVPRELRSAPPAGPLALDEMLVAVHGASSGIAEDLRILRTKILHPPEGAPPAKTILITSTVPGEGKTFLAANLGITMAQTLEHHVLVIDSDLRRPALAGMFDLPQRQGLVDYLQGRMRLAEVLQKTAVEKLSILPSGPVPINPAELIDSEKMAALLAEVAERYADRFIILDTPPVNVASETEVLIKLVDKVIFVVRHGRAPRALAQKVLGAIPADKLLGLVFNAAPKSGTRAKYRDYYKYYDYRAQPLE